MSERSRRQRHKNAAAPAGTGAVAGGLPTAANSCYTVLWHTSTAYASTSHDLSHLLEKCIERIEFHADQAQRWRKVKRQLEEIAFGGDL